MRVGFGYSSVQINGIKSIIIGGETIIFGDGIEQNKESDVLVDAISDALLGAAALGDINDHIPGFKKKFKEYKSIDFLKEIEKKINFEKFKISNIDATLVLQNPKLSEYKSQIKNNIAYSLYLKPNQVNIKITNPNNPEFAEIQNSINCYAVVLLIAK